jgi:hypothetical protein
MGAESSGYESIAVIISLCSPLCDKSPQLELASFSALKGDGRVPLRSMVSFLGFFHNRRTA